MDYILSFREYKKRIQSFDTVPRDMAEVYNDVFRRIKGSQSGDKELVMRILSWLFRAQRTLAMGELLEALAVEDSEPDDQLDEILQQVIEPSEVIDSCKSLVQYEKSSGLVRFSHHTVQEFIAARIQELPPASHMAKSCLVYLTLDDSEEVRLETRPFRRYATQFWDVHTRDTEESPVVQQAALRLFTSPRKMNKILRFESESAFLCSSHRGYRASLHIVVEKGLATICKLILEASQKNKQCLLESTDKNGCTPLQVAANMGHHKVVDALLTVGSDANIQNNVGDTALHMAARHGHEVVVERLLNANPDFDLKDNDGETAAHAAASHGHDPVIKILLNANADVTIQDDQGQTALHAAASHGMENVVNTLLSANVDVNIQDHDGRTALHAAASHGHVKVVSILLAAGAGVSISDIAGETPLSVAAWKGHKMVVERLQNV